MILTLQRVIYIGKEERARMTLMSQGSFTITFPKIKTYLLKVNMAEYIYIYIFYWRLIGSKVTKR